MEVVQLSRFPVKSMTGEQLDRLALDARGVDGDRAWAVRTDDGHIGSGKSTRRFRRVPGLLDVVARTVGDAVEVTFPDGTTYGVDDAAAAERLSVHVGRPVAFARETDVDHFDDGPVSLLGTASVQAVTASRNEDVDPQRFRANVLVATTEPHVEQTWVGREVRLGTAGLRVVLASPRCVMVDLGTALLPPQPGNLKAVTALTDGLLGVVAEVVEPGVVRVGDVLRPL